MAIDDHGVELPMRMSGVPALLMVMKLLDFLVQKRVLSEPDKVLFYREIAPLFEVSNPDMQAVKRTIETILQSSP